MKQCKMGNEWVHEWRIDFFKPIIYMYVYLPLPKGSNLGFSPGGMTCLIGLGTIIFGSGGTSVVCMMCIWPLNFGPE